MSTVAITLIQLAMITLAVLLALACVIGTGVLVRPALLERLHSAGGGIGGRIAGALNRPHDADRWFYRRNRVYGATVGILAAVLLGFLTFGDPGHGWLSALDPRYRDVGALLAQAARIVLWLFGIFALILATVVFTRPSALKGLEGLVNRWITPSSPLAGLEREIRGPDRWAARYPRAWGALIALISAMCLLALVLHADSLARLGM